MKEYITTDDIIRMAREAGCPETATEGVFIVNTDDLGRMLAAEREECAKEIASKISDEIEDEAYCILLAMVARIRARGQG